MVQKYQSPVRVYKYPFELVMAVSMQLIGYIQAYFVVSMNALRLFPSQLLQLKDLTGFQ